MRNTRTIENVNVDISNCKTISLYVTGTVYSGGPGIHTITNLVIK